MLNATVSKIGRNGGVSLIRYQFTLPTVGASSTGDEQTLNNIAGRGRIKQVSVACDSDDFDISIRDKASAAAGSINEIFSVLAPAGRTVVISMPRCFTRMGPPVIVNRVVVPVRSVLARSTELTRDEPPNLAARLTLARSPGNVNK